MHKQAALNTAKNFAFGIFGAAIGITAIELLTPTQIAIGLVVGLLGFMVHIMYSIEKSRLELIENLNSRNTSETV